MGLLKSLDISSSGMTAQRFRMDMISENLANAQTTRMADGKPYVRKYIVLQEREGNGPLAGTTSFAARLRQATGALGGGSTLNYAANAGSTPLDAVGGGVRVVEVREDTAPFRLDYDPTHVDAQEDGYVRYPNVETVTDMVDMMDAYRAYEACVTAFQQTKSMALKGLEIGK